MDKIKELLTGVKKYWKIPPKGNYMNYHEIASYSFGGIGVYCLITIINSMLLSTTNTLIGNTIGVDPTTMYFLYVIAIVANIPLTGLRANIIDNSRSKDGKYRPFIIKMGIPCTVLAIAFVWTPYEHMPYAMTCAVILFFNVCFQFFFNFFKESYDNLIHVLSPNTQERTNVLAIKAVVYSLGPTIMNPLMPIFAGIICDGNLNDIRLYRYVYPPIALLSMLLSLIVYTNTHEKIVQAKTHVTQVKFTDALRAVIKNKYFWIISCAGWIGFLEGAQVQLLYWLYQYGKVCSANQYALITVIYGNASLWGMLAAPMAIKRFGKQKVIIATNLCNIVLILILYPFINNIWLVLMCFYLNAIVSSFSHVVDPSIQADIRDYQHYISGERIDGMFSAVGLIGSVITMATSSVLPMIYRINGITQTNAEAAVAKFNIVKDSISAYDALYDPQIFSHLVYILITVSAVGAAMNVIPYFFYDLSEVKQRGMIKVLRVRAMFEDYGNNAVNRKELAETMSLVREAEAMANKQPLPESKDEISAAKRSGNRAAITEAKKAYKEAIEYNKTIIISRMVVDEINKFNTPEVIAELEQARAIYAGGLNELTSVDPFVLTNARALPKETKEEKVRRKAAIETARSRLTSKRLIDKHYPDGLKEFDRSVLDKLFAREDEMDEQLSFANKQMFKAKDNKNAELIRQYSEEIKRIKGEKKTIAAEIKSATNELSLYNRAARPYLEAKKLIKQEENYRHYDEISAEADQYK